jgi:predicted Zn-dependent peptidase
MTDLSSKTVLPNGIRILTKKIPYVRSASMGLWVNVGARDESDDRNGISHFIEHMLFKGTEKRTGYQIAKEFDAIGGYSNAFTSMENTCYHAKVMDSRLDVMVDILSDIFLNSVFEESEIEKERPVVLQEISMVEDSPEDYIHTLSSGAYWGDNPLARSVLGTRENIMKFDARMIKGYFSDYYQPDRIVIAAAGNLEHGQIVDLVGPHFERLSPVHKEFPPRVTPEECAGIELKQKQLEQVHVCLGTKGIPIADPRRYAFSLMNTILGGNMSSRLFQQIREKHGLAYSVYSFAASYTDTGMFGAYVGVDPNRSLTAVELILNEMRLLKKNRIDDAELRDAKEYTKGSLILASENTDNQMVRMAQNEMHFGRDFSLDEVLAAIDQVTPDDILTLVQTLFDTRHLSLTLLGPVDNPTPFRERLAV